jgi:2-isopropylmalate synthase
MSPSQKMTFFRMLVGVGFKEIEVAYPAASDLDFSFVRKVVEDNEAGDDVFIQVRPRSCSHLVPGRERRRLSARARAVGRTA